MAPEQTDCVLGAQNKERIRALERDVGEVKGAMIMIRDNLITRPTWTVVIVISLLSSGLSIAVGVILTMIRVWPK